MTSSSEGMLRVFISSTQKDLKEERLSLINKINESLSAIGMESFVSDGRTSQEIALLDDKKGLKNCDLAIFIISPYYGSLLDRCRIDYCKADCDFKKNEKRKISYTHCEYRFAVAEKKPIQIYIIDRDWNVIKKFKELDIEQVDWNIFASYPEIKNLDKEYADHLFLVKDLVTEFKQEIEKSFCPRIDTSEDILIISNDLSENIVKWYSEGKINIKDFCGRRKELKDLLEKMEDSVEVYGVGGIGKTTLIQVALLIQKLKGKKILTIGKKQSYFSGSGYHFFKEKCKNSLFEITGDIISINDVLNALGLLSIIKNETLKEKIRLIENKILDENLIIFIDDFHLTDASVKDLVKSSKGFVISSKSMTGVARNELRLSGIEISERDTLIDLISNRLGKSISDIAREKIKNIAEGHPVSTEILVRNFDRIDFNKLENYKDALSFSNPDHTQEFLKRVINDILTPKSYDLLKSLSMINTELENDINKKIVGMSYADSNLNLLFLELIDRGFLRKKQKSEDVFEFSFKHIQDALKEESVEYHKRTANYYKNKIQRFEENIDDKVELLYHQIRHQYDQKLFRKFRRIASEINPTNYSYKGLIEIGKDLESIVDKDEISRLYDTLGVLYKNIQWYEDAEENITKALTLQRDLVKINRFKHVNGLVPILVNQGNLFLDLNFFDQAYTAYKEALEILLAFTQKNIVNQQKNQITIYNNIGLCYYHLQDYSESEAIYQHAISLINSIPRRFHKIIREEESLIYSNLGMLYTMMHRYKEAETALKNSLKLSKELSISDPLKYKNRYAGNLQNFAIFNRDLNRFYESEKLFREALGILKEFAEKSPDAFQLDYARVQNNLANTLGNLKKISEAKILYENSCNLLLKLYNENKEVYRPEFSRYYNNFGSFYLEILDYQNASKFLEKSLEKCEEESFQKKSNACLQDYAEVQKNFAIYYNGMNDNKIAKKYYDESIQSGRNLVKKDRGSFLPMLTDTLIKYGNFSLRTGDLELAGQLLRESLENARYLMTGCPEANLPLLVESLANNGVLEIETGNFPRAKELLKEALDRGETLKNKCPEAFTRTFIEVINAFGLYYFETEKYERSLQCLNQAIKMAEEQVDKYQKSEIKILIDVLSNFKRYYLKIDDSVKITEISRKISDIKSEYCV